MFWTELSVPYSEFLKCSCQVPRSLRSYSLSYKFLLKCISQKVKKAKVCLINYQRCYGKGWENGAGELQKRTECLVYLSGRVILVFRQPSLCARWGSNKKFTSFFSVYNISSYPNSMNTFSHYLFKGLLFYFLCFILPATWHWCFYFSIIWTQVYFIFLPPFLFFIFSTSSIDIVPYAERAILSHWARLLTLSKSSVYIVLGGLYYSVYLSVFCLCHNA